MKILTTYELESSKQLIRATQTGQIIAFTANGRHITGTVAAVRSGLTFIKLPARGIQEFSIKHITDLRVF